MLSKQLERRWECFQSNWGDVGNIAKAAREMLQGMLSKQLGKCGECCQSSWENEGMSLEQGNCGECCQSRGDVGNVARAARERGECCQNSWRNVGSVAKAAGQTVPTLVDFQLLKDLLHGWPEAPLPHTLFVHILGQDIQSTFLATLQDLKDRVQD